ncbi:MAG: 30S ribosomal protein S2, partial [Candidatus Zixiibacteriota bacterium]
IKDMTYLPGLVFVVDAKKEKIAVSEALKQGIPIIGIIDTNADPDPIDFPIAANDDAIKSIRIITKTIVDAILDAKNKVSSGEMEDFQVPEKENLHAYVSEDTEDSKDN